MIELLVAAAVGGGLLYAKRRRAVEGSRGGSGPAFTWNPDAGTATLSGDVANAWRANTGGGSMGSGAGNFGGAGGEAAFGPTYDKAIGGVMQNRDMDTRAAVIEAERAALVF